MHGTILIDTNILLSFLLDQNDVKNTEKFLVNAERQKISLKILDFAFYSTCVALDRLGEERLMKELILTIEKLQNIEIIKPKTKEILEALIYKVNLDFDDRLHYYFSRKYNLNFISYDNDFKKTDIKIYTPKEALNLLGLS